MKRIGLLVLLVGAVFVPIVTNAGGYRRGGVVRTPYGSANINSPEWKQSGGDFRVYQRIMQQKQMMLQQRAMMKQRQAFLKQQEKGEKAKPTTTGDSRPASASKTGKKPPTRKASPASVASQKEQTPSKTVRP